MSIQSGYKKVKDRILESSGYKLISRWTSSNTVEFDDGNTAQTKVGAIKGLSNSIDGVTESGFALDAKAAKDEFDSINNSLQIVLLQSGETYKFYQYGKMRFLILTGMQGNSFLNMNFEKHKPIVTMGEMCYYKTPDGKNYSARASVLPTGKSSGTIIMSESKVIEITSGSSGLLYGTLIWIVE